MANLAIRGHETRGNEVIEILKMLGGKNVYNLSGDTWSVYYALENGEICYGDISNGPYTILSLEEFLEKFPYKVGDNLITDEKEIATVVGLKWNTDIDEVFALVRIGTKTFTYPMELLESYENKITIDDFKANTKEWLIDKLESMSHDDALMTICELYNKLHTSQYPKTYNECCEVLKIPDDKRYIGIYVPLDYNKLLFAFTQLLICRDAYWKIAGKEMGLDKPWEPKHEYDEEIIFIYCDRVNGINKGQGFPTDNFCLVFPTAEMRDAFYENFKDLIEQCKELL